jgi:hypothetical protein
MVANPGFHPELLTLRSTRSSFAAAVALRAFAPLLAAAAALAQAPAAQVRLINHSPYWRTEWARATVPFAEGVWTDGQRFGAHGYASVLEPFGARWPDGSARYGELFVRVTLAPFEERLLAVTENGGWRPPFALSAWVQRALAGFRWQLLVGVPGLGVRAGDLRLTEVVGAHEARVTLLFRARIPDTDLVYDFWLSLLNDQDHAPFELRLTCSNVASARWSNDVEWVALGVYGAYPHVHGAGLRGAVPLVQPTVDGFNLLQLMGHATMWDGQAQEWYGDLLFAKPDGTESDREQRLSTLAAAFDHRLHGCATNWRESRAFGPFGAIPPDPPWVTDGGRRAAEIERNISREWARRPLPPWSDLPLGLRPLAGTTGDQADFGAAKLVDIVAGGWPHRIEECRLNASEEAYRPVHHREPDGTPVRAAAHPWWVALNGRAHFNRTVSPDRLGKPFPEPWIDGNGWSGKDNQHWSSLHLASTYLLTGSFSLRAELDNEAELYLSSHTLPSQRRTVSSNDIDEPRAVGRTLLSMSWNHLVTGRDDVRERMRERVRQCIVPQFLGLQVGGPVRPVRIQAPDARVFPKDWFWKPWEESLAIVGLEACARATGDLRAHQLAVLSAKTLVTFGWKVTASETIIATGIRWKFDGAPLTAAEYDSRDWVLWSYGTGFSEWALASTRLALVYGQLYQDADMFGRAAVLLQRLYARRAPPRDLGWDRFADWEAVPFF